MSIQPLLATFPIDYPQGSLVVISGPDFGILLGNLNSHPRESTQGKLVYGGPSEKSVLTKSIWFFKPPPNIATVSPNIGQHSYWNEMLAAFGHLFWVCQHVG